MNGLPNFFVAGAMKAGTTAIFRYLRQHPDVFMAAMKEPHFFSERSQSEWRGPDTRGGPRPTPAEYRTLFAGARGQRARGEATPLYLWDPVALARIRDAVPNAKIIAILRQPVDRAYSAWLMKCRQGLEHLPFEEALAEEPRRIAEEWRPAWYYAALGRYRRQLETCCRIFTPSQTKVVLFDDFVHDTPAVMRDVFRFLEVDEAFEVDFGVSRNDAHLTRVPRLSRWMISPSRVRLRVKRRAPRLAGPLWKGLKRLHDVLNVAPAPRLAPDLRARLTREWDAEILAVQGFLGRDLSAWRGDSSLEIED